MVGNLLDVASIKYGCSKDASYWVAHNFGGMRHEFGVEIVLSLCALRETSTIYYDLLESPLAKQTFEFNM